MNLVKARLWPFGLVLAIGVLLTTSLSLSTGISKIGHLYIGADCHGSDP